MKNTVNIKTYLLPIAFLAILLIHFSDQIFSFIPEPELKERRALSERPELNFSFLDPYPAQAEAYYNDHFNWRNYFIKASSYLNYYTFKKSALPEKVIIGKEGWLFKSGFQLDIYRGKFLFSKEQLEEIKNELLRRKSFVEQIGGKYYLAIPPLKHHIYPEYLPDNVTLLNAKNCTAQLVQFLQENTDLNYIDLFEPILTQKQKSPHLLYFKTDHHWTNIAAFEAAKVLMQALQKDFPQLKLPNKSQYSISEVEFDGMLLAQMLGMEKEIKERFSTLNPTHSYLAKDTLRTYKAPHDFPFPNDYVWAKKTERSEQPTLFMVRESFASSLVDFIADEFEYSFFLFDNWKHQFNQSIYEKEKGDIYVQMIWEGLLFNLLDNPPAEAGW